MTTSPEANNPYLVTSPHDKEIDFGAVVITNSTGEETIVSAGRIPDTDATLLFSLPFERLNKRQLSVRVGVFSGTVPDKSDANWGAFEQSARRVAESGQAFLVENFAERVKQIIRDEQQYARQNPHK